jgi:ribosomal protein S18 acetylase RimI-like enzyme
MNPKVEGPVDGRRVKLDPRNPAHVEAAVRLTIEIFGKSPAGQLGEFFLRHFYFVCLPSLGLIDCLLYEVEGKFIGFIVYTDQPYTFIESGTRKFFFRLGFTVLWSLLTKPTRWFAVWNVRGQDNWRRTAERDPGLCEMLTFGVQTPFRKRIDRSSGQKISRCLFEAALEDMRRRGKERCLLVIAKDNFPINRFYFKYQVRNLMKDYSNDFQELWVFDLEPSKWTKEVV